MKILLVDSDRDFLNSFRKLFEFSGHEVETVFDGTQALMKIPAGNFDVVVLEQNIPRISSRDIVRLLNEEKIPVVVILECSLNSALLAQPVLANDYLSLPFYPQELVDTVIEAGRRKGIQQPDISFGEGTDIYLSGDRLCGQAPLTNTEIKILCMLSESSLAGTKNIDTYISSINNKLSELQKQTRIQYIRKEGYRLVMNHE